MPSLCNSGGEPVRYRSFPGRLLPARYERRNTTQRRGTDQRAGRSFPELQDVLWATEKAKGATPGNGWGVLNGVTYWADHIAGNSMDSRLFNSWLGRLRVRFRDQVKARDWLSW